MLTKLEWKKLIEAAERSFLEVAHSWPVDEKLLEINGVQLRLVAERYDEPKKIYRYFRRCWSPLYSRRMMGNLKVTQVNGETYILLGDAMAPNEVTALRVLKASSHTALLEAKLEPGAVRVRYKLRKSPRSGKWCIISRSKLDYRYKRCGCLLPHAPIMPVKVDENEEE